jgi:cytochrome c2
MHWRRSTAPWPVVLAVGAAALGFWLGSWRPGHAGQPGGDKMESAVQKKARPGHVLRIACAVLVLGGAGFGAWVWMQRQQDTALAVALTGGKPAHGPALMIRFGCAGCHTIPGVPGADGQVGPSLSGLRKRVYVGNGVRNTAEGLMAWITNPRALSPRSAMPITGISSGEARDVAAYLYTQ